MTAAPVETSIVIRTLNESKHLEDLLKGIHSQNYKNWEIVLVDSGSTDGTPDIARRYGARIFHIPSHEFTFGRSLNIGCREARGDYLVFASGHVWPVTNNWLRNMITPFQDSSVAMVYGRQQGTETSSLSEHRDLHVQYGRTSHILVDEPKGNNGNAAVRRDLWLEQPFDESLPGLEDVDWARKVEKNSYRVYYAADASVVHAHEETLRQVYRRHQREAVATKWMFPNYTLALSGMLRAWPYFTARDVLYAFRQKQRGKIFQIPATRFAQFLGIYRGVRYQKELMRKLTANSDIPETHQRLVFQGPGNYSLEKVETPEILPGQVLVQVGYVGVSFTDVETARNGATNTNPVSLGHEFAGVIVKIGADAGRLRRGRKVVGRFSVGCGQCRECLAGQNYSCGSPNDSPPLQDGGAYAPFLPVAANQLCELPANMSLKLGALVEPVAVCVEALAKLGAQPGQQACVIGCNATGNICSQILNSRGVKVTAIDGNSKLVSLLYKYDIDTLSEIHDVAKFDHVIVADAGTGQLDEMRDGLNPAAKLLLLGTSRPGAVDANGQILRHSVATQPGSWQEAIRLVESGTINLDDHIATVEPLEAYDKIWAGVEKGETFKVLINVAKELQAL